MANRDRYKEFERMMAASLVGNTLLFVLYLIAAGAGIGWLKVLSAIVCIGICGMGLWMLFASRELTKPRSLWLSCGFFAILCCILSSLILAYPG